MEVSEKTSGLYHKCFTIVIYDHNNSGQYYKSCTIVIYDRNQSTIVGPVF